MKADARFQQFLIDPTVKTAVKIDGLTGASEKLGLNELTKNLLLCLAENHRYDTDGLFGKYFILSSLQGQLHRSCGELLQHLDGRPQG